MMLRKILKVLFDNFSERTKNSQTLKSNSPVIKDVFISEGCADIKKEKIGKVSARR